MTDTFVRIGNPRVKERSSTTVTAYFRDSSNAAAVPSTVHYRIDDIAAEENITGWTSVTPAASVSIAIKSNENRILANGNKRERRQITVAADKGTDTETRDTAEWFIENIGGYDEASP